MFKEVYYLIALIAGAAVATQAGINSELNLTTNNSSVTALISFLVGTVILFAYVLITNYNSIPSALTLSNSSWWKYTGGALGAFYITIVIIAAPKIGAANTLGFIVAGQLMAAIIYDHFGLIGFPIKPISFYRVLGVGLMIVGVYLIRKF